MSRNNTVNSTTRLNTSRWQKICSMIKVLMRYISLCRSRWLWFLTPANIVGLGTVLFVAAVFKQAIPHDVLPKTGLVRYETVMDTAYAMESRMERFERQQMMQQQAYLDKLQRIEQALRSSMAEVRAEIHNAIFMLRSEIERYKVDSEEVAHATTKALVGLQRQINEHLAAMEEQLEGRVADVESRIVAANKHTRASVNTCSASPPTFGSLKSTIEKKKRHAVNLASRSHGAFVIAHLTSRAVTSGSMLYNFVGTLFGLETYNFAITERTHIMPSEAFCFEGSEGKLTIHLWSNASVDAVEYEHDYWNDIVPISAPNRYDVMACMDRECANASLLAECHYPVNEKDGPAQICKMQNKSTSTDQVQVVFRSNHGQEYTCVYQLRVLSWK